MENKPSSATGSTIVIALLTFAVLAFVGANVLMNVMSRYTGTLQTRSWQEALTAAEAGSDYGLANFRWTVSGASSTPWTGWVKANGTSVTDLADATAALAAGQTISYP